MKVISHMHVPQKRCITKSDPKGYHNYMLTHNLQNSHGSHFAIVDSGTPIHIVFDHLFVCKTKEDNTPVAGFSGTASRATHRGDLNARVRTHHNEYITLIDVHSTLVVPARTFHALLPLCPSQESPCNTSSAAENYIIVKPATGSHCPAISRRRGRVAVRLHTRSRRPATPHGNT